ncbi:hypothetical protein BG005_004509, partial [Podila minutissima]
TTITNMQHKRIERIRNISTRKKARMRKMPSHQPLKTLLKHLSGSKLFSILQPKSPGGHHCSTSSSAPRKGWRKVGPRM